MKYLLLTGATGLLGRYLLRDLTLADERIAVVTRPSRWESARQRIESLMVRWERELGRPLVRPVVLEGDISQPNLGLSAAQSQWVADACRGVIHSAASLTFYADAADGEPWRSNLHGTRHVLALCRQARIREFHHVSTAYVCGKRRGRILESELNVGQQAGNDYEQSKLTAEEDVHAAGIFDSLTVYRPSIIVGDSQSGYTNTFHGFYTPLRLVHGLIQSVPWDVVLQSDFLGGLQLAGDERKNLVPVDWVSAAMAALITNPAHHGTTYHLTNPNPATSGEMLLAIAQALGEIATANPKPPSAKEIPADFLESFREQMKVYQSYWSDDPEFDSARTAAAVPNLPCPPVDRAMMDRLIQFAVTTNFGWPREMPIVPAFDVAAHLAPWLAAGTQTKTPSNGSAPAAACVNLQVSGPGGGQWHLLTEGGRVVGAGLGLQPGAAPACYLHADTFARLARGEMDSQESLQSGRLLATGPAVRPADVARLFRGLSVHPT